MHPVLLRTISLIPMIPSVVMGIEAIFKGAKSGATKKEMALASLGLSTAVANVVAPEHKEAIEQASQLASNIINGIVATLNAAHGKNWNVSNNVNATASASAGK